MKKEQHKMGKYAKVKPKRQVKKMLTSLRLYMVNLSMATLNTLAKLYVFLWREGSQHELKATRIQVNLCKTSSLPVAVKWNLPLQAVITDRSECKGTIYKSANKLNSTLRTGAIPE